jgi:hypothetical protein
LNLEIDSGDFALGAEARIGVATIVGPVRLDVRPFFDYYFIDEEAGVDVSLFGLGADAIFAFKLSRPIVEPYALAGLSIFIASVEFAGESESETEVGFNLGGGARFLTDGFIQPFVELRLTLGDVDPILIGGGVLFAF